jgi:hypothetical protein
MYTDRTDLQATSLKMHPQFRETGIIPEARRIGRISPAAARLADRRAAMEAIVREMGNTKNFAIEESMVRRAAVPWTRSFIRH